MIFNNHIFFTYALGLAPPWQVNDLKFSITEQQLDIWVGCPTSSTFPCPAAVATLLFTIQEGRPGAI